MGAEVDSRVGVGVKLWTGQGRGRERVVVRFTTEDELCKVQLGPRFASPPSPDAWKPTRTWRSLTNYERRSDCLQG